MFEPIPGNSSFSFDDRVQASQDHTRTAILAAKILGVLGATLASVFLDLPIVACLGIGVGCAGLAYLATKLFFFLKNNESSSNRGEPTGSQVPNAGASGDLQAQVSDIVDRARARESQAFGSLRSQRVTQPQSQANSVNREAQQGSVAINLAGNGNAQNRRALNAEEASRVSIKQDRAALKKSMFQWISSTSDTCKVIFKSIESAQQQLNTAREKNSERLVQYCSKLLKERQDDAVRTSSSALSVLRTALDTSINIQSSSVLSENEKSQLKQAVAQLKVRAFPLKRFDRALKRLDQHPF